MSGQWVDYYQILQVHFTADPEIIRSAYLKLSKRYHPDGNASSESQAQMVLINQAYETLIDPQLKSHYMRHWVAHLNPITQWQEFEINQGGEIDPLSPLYQVIKLYFECIQQGRLVEAYNLLSNYDKKRIFKDAFIKWQQLVGQVYEIVSVEWVVDHMDEPTDMFYYMVDFKVQIVEKNLLMDKIEKDIFHRKLVYEGMEWKIFLGRSDLSETIGKYQRLVSLKSKKHKIRFQLTRSNGIDVQTGIMTRSGFLTRLNQEHNRYRRYNNPYVIIGIHMVKKNSEKNMNDKLTIQLDKGLRKSIRQLDVIGQWDKNIYFILLPETDETAVTIVLKKLEHLIGKVIEENGQRGLVEVKTSWVNQKDRNIKELLQELLNNL